MWCRPAALDLNGTADIRSSGNWSFGLTPHLPAGSNQPIRATGSATFITPSVVHFKVDHFAAMIRRVGDRYLLEDPTFKNDAWVTVNALEAEASGYFLVPPRELPKGWRSVDAVEAETVWGRGFVPNPPEPSNPCDHNTDQCQPCPQGGGGGAGGAGMAVASTSTCWTSL